MSQGGPKKKVTSSIVAMSSAAVLAVYTAGYTRTRSAAMQLDAQTAMRMAPPAARPRAEAHAADPEPAASAHEEPGSPSASPPAKEAPVEKVAPTPPEPAVRAIPAKPAEVANAAPDGAVPPNIAPTTAPVAVPPAEPATPLPAPAPAPAPEVKPESATVTPAPAKPAATWKDGTYTGWGSCRHGDIQASVVIKDGRIESAKISDCRTRYSCSVIDILPPEVPQRQSAEVDYVSGATQSANAFYYAVTDALSKAK
jgi:uncharacterized protein with FMN-binding domain